MQPQSWSLSAGSKAVLEDGVCLLGTAIIAAGYPARPVGSSDDCPASFSRPIADFGIRLNDRMDGPTRQRLLSPFVVRLAGTADCWEVERARDNFLVIGATRVLIAQMLRDLQFEAEAAICEGVSTRQQAQEALKIARKLSLSADASCAVNYALSAALLGAVDDAAACAGWVVKATGNVDLWSLAVRLLDEAIQMGVHGPPVPMDVAIERLAQAQVLA